MADTIKTIKSSGGDYTSLAAWNGAMATTVTTGNRHIAECYSFADTGSAGASLTMSGWVIDAGAELIIRTPLAERHTGTLGTGYRIEGGNSYYLFAGVPARCTFDGIAMRNTWTGANNGVNALSAAAVACKILNCFCTKALTTGSVLDLTGSGKDYTLVNTVAIGGDGAVIIRNNFPSGYFYNCVFVGATNGLVIDYVTTVLIKNTYMAGTTPYGGVKSGTITFTTCQHSTSQSITGSTGSIAYSTANLTNVTAGSEDTNLPTGSALISAGTDLSGDSVYPFSTDYKNTTRTTPWTVGMHHVSAAAAVFTKSIKALQALNRASGF